VSCSRNSKLKNSTVSSRHQQAPVMKVRGRVFDSAKRERLDRSVRRCLHSVYHLRLVEAFRLKIVHKVVCVIRGCVTFHASRLEREPKNNCCPHISAAAAFLGYRASELGENPESLRTPPSRVLDCRGPEHSRLSFQQRPGQGRNTHGTLLKLGEVLDCFERPLRSQQGLNVAAA
jgi:hypothetical protein